MNKFEQVSSLGHQVSLVGGAGVGVLYRGEAQGLMRNGHMRPPL